ncbi:MAG: hypothetical protein FWC20_04390 [Oscillospiraceae bacterium]|nr:hypothetical protein [Oscillospiraceae bacterium]MCL2278631.1 hypothetical protein [Oscillospiraceae bacterium]
MGNLYQYSKIAESLRSLIPDLPLSEQEIEQTISEKGLLYFATNSGKEVAELFEAVLLLAHLYDMELMSYNDKGSNSALTV